MMAQDMTKVILVLVLLGACLAVAVFRPQILPPPTPTSVSPASSSCSTALQEGTGQSLVPQAPSDPAQPEPTPAPEGMAPEGALKQQELEKRQAELDRLEKELEERQAELDRLEKELEERRVALDRWEKELKEQQAALARLEEELKRREEAVVQRERELDHREANLAAERDELERLWRWVLAVAVITGLLALPSIFALYLLWKVNREAVELAQSARAAREGVSWKAAPSGRPTAAAEVLSGGNGRGQREEVRHRR